MPILAILKRINAPVNGKYLEIYIRSSEFIVGRSLQASFNILDTLISRKHAVFQYNGNQWCVTHHSCNAFQINDHDLAAGEPHLLVNGDVLKFSGEAYQYAFVTCDARCVNYCKRKRNVSPPKNKLDLPSTSSGTSHSPRRLNENQLDERYTADSQHLTNRYSVQANEIKQRFKDHQREQLRITLQQIELNGKLVKKREELNIKRSQQDAFLNAKVTEVESVGIQLLPKKERFQIQHESEKEELTNQLTAENHQLEHKLHDTNLLREKFLQERAALITESEQKLNNVTNESLKTQKELLGELEVCKQDQEQLKHQKCKLQLHFDLKKILLEQKYEQEREEIQLKLTQMKLSLLNKDSRIAELEKQFKEREDFRNDEIKKIMAAEYQKKQLLEEEMNNKIGDISRSAEQRLHELQRQKDALEEQHKGQLERMESTCQLEVDRYIADNERMQSELKKAKQDKAKLADQEKMKAKKEMELDLEEVLDSEMQCSICNEHFVKAITLNCSHTFCSYCIHEWRKRQDTCPNCRAPIRSEIHSLVVDSIIKRFYTEKFSEQTRKRRHELVQERDDTLIEPVPGSIPILSDHGTRYPETLIISDDSDDDSYEDTEPGFPAHGNYGRCFNCFQYGHWASACPYI